MGISVVIPVYNVEKYLRECLESLSSQSFKNWEAVIVDDGSTDNSLLIAQEFEKKDSRFKIFKITNGGPSKARNVGLNNVNYPYVTFMDSDDMLFPDALKTLYETLLSSGADIVQGKAIIGKKPPKNIITSNYPTIKLYNADEAVEDVLYQKTLLPAVWGNLYKIELFKEISFEEGLYYEDLAFFYRIFFKAKKIAYLDRPVYFYRMTPGSIMHTWNERRLHVLKVTEEIENFMSSNHPYLLPAARDRRLSANFNIFALTSAHKDKTTADNCWNLIRLYRVEALANPKVRLKNKTGVLLSYFGKTVFSLTSKLIYKSCE